MPNNTNVPFLHIWCIGTTFFSTHVQKPTRIPFSTICHFLLFVALGHVGGHHKDALALLGAWVDTI